MMGGTVLRWLCKMGDNAPIIWIWRQSDEMTSIICGTICFLTTETDEVARGTLLRGIACKAAIYAVWAHRELILHDPEGNELLFL